MSKLLTALLLLAGLAATSADAQIVVPEVTPLGKFVRVEAQLEVPDDPVQVEHELAWTIDADCEAHELCDGEQLLLVGTPGTHTLGLTVKTRTYIERTVFVPDPDDPTDITKAKIETLRIAVDIDMDRYSATFTVGDAPDPEPVPPDPDPEPTPPESGARNVFIIRESEDDTPALAALFVSLRAGPSATWLRNQGHKLTILDDDEGDGKGGRAPDLVKLDPALAGVPLPALIITDKATGKVLTKATITAATTADNVVEAITRTGG